MSCLRKETRTYSWFTSHPTGPPLPPPIFQCSWVICKFSLPWACFCRMMSAISEATCMLASSESGKMSVCMRSWARSQSLHVASRMTLGWLACTTLERFPKKDHWNRYLDVINVQFSNGALVRIKLRRTPDSWLRPPPFLSISFLSLISDSSSVPCTNRFI